MSGYTDEELSARMEFNGWQKVVDAVGDPFGHPDYPWTGWAKTSGDGARGYPCRDEPFKGEDISFTARARKMVGHEDRCEECTRWIEYGNLVGYETDKIGTGEVRHCFECRNWLERIELADAAPGSRFVTATHEYYSIGPRTTPSTHNGFGGTWWLVRWPDGTKQQTCDLWYGGKAPERFWGRLAAHRATLEAL